MSKISPFDVYPNNTTVIDPYEAPSHLQNESKNSPRRCRCPTTDGQCRRRLMRLVFFMLLIVSISFGLYGYHFFTYLSTSLSFTPSTLFVEISSCTLNLHSDASLPSGEVSASVETYIKDSVSDSSTELKVSNDIGDVHMCTVDLYASSYPTLSITCKDTCVIEQKDDSISFNGGFTINSDELVNEGRVKFKTISAPSLSVNFWGSVTIDNMSVSSSSFTLYNGDLFIKSQNGATINWTTNEAGAYCIAGLQALTLSSSCQSGVKVVSGSRSYPTESCTGQLRVCADSTCSLNSVYANVSNGGIYYSAIDSSGGLVGGYSTVQSTTDMSLDLKARIQIDEIKDELFDEDIRKDKLILIKMPGPNDSDGKWLYTTNIAYAQLKPWWLNLVSFGLLVPENTSITARTIPFICPYTGSATSTSELGQIWRTIYDSFDARSDDVVAWMEISSSEDVWHSFSQDADLNYQQSEIKLLNNPFLFAALLISVFLGLLGGLAGAIVSVYLLRNYSYKFWNKIKHYKQYLRCKGTVDSAHEVYGFEDDDDDDFIEEELSNSEVNEANEYQGLGIMKLPPPFAIPDLVVRGIQKKRTDSLVSFFKFVVKEVRIEDDIPDQYIRVIDLKEIYEKYCFTNGYKEQDMRDRKSAILKYDMEFVSLSDTTTEVFKKLRLKTQQELVRQGSVHQIVNEDSLSFFVRTKCKVTPFEGDSILIKDFQNEYTKFCRQSKITDPVPITKRALELMGADFERQNILSLKADGSYRINMAEASKKVEKPSTSPLPPNWILYDLISVCLHLLIIFIFAVPVAIIPIYTEIVHSELSAREPDSILRQSDLLYSWWLIPEKIWLMPLYFRILLALGVLLWILSIVELVSYYINRKFPMNLETMIAGTKGCKRFLQIMLYTIVFCLIGLICMAIIIALCWYILGAVLNPDKYLPYAAAAITLITFCSAQLAQINYLRTEILKKVKEFVWQKLNGLVKSTLNDIIGSSDSASLMKLATSENKTLELFARTPLGSIAEKIGIDHKLASALAQGEDAAVVALGDKFGVHPLVVKSILAVSKRDFSKLYDIVGELSIVPGISIDPEAAKMLVSIALKQNEANLRTAVKVATVQFNKIKSKFGNKSINIDPRIVESLVAMSRGNVDRLIEYLMNSEIIPKPTLDLLRLLKVLVEKDFNDTAEILLNILCDLVDMPPDLARGVGCLCCESFGGDSQGDTSGWNTSIDVLCNVLNIPEPILVQMIVNQARGSGGNIQKLLMQILEFFSSKFGWKFDKSLLRSLIAVSQGVELSIEKLSVKYELNQELAQGLAALFADMQYLEMPLQALKEYDNIIDSSTVAEPMGSKLESWPALKAVADLHQPSQNNLNVIGKTLKLTGLQTLGLYAIITGARKHHKRALRAITQEVMRKMKVDEKFLDFFTAITVWLASKDAGSIRKAQVILKMQFRELTFVAKQMLDPKDLPSGYMIQYLGFSSDDPLVRRRKALSWQDNVSICKDWCKSSALKVTECNSLSQVKRLIARGQLISAVQYPHIFVKKLIDSRLAIEDTAIFKFKSLLNMAFIKNLQGVKRRDAITNLARLFDVEVELLEGWVGMITSPSLDSKISSMHQWSSHCKIENVENIERFVVDYTHQEELFYGAIMGFTDLAMKVGVPVSFINFLTQGICDDMQNHPETLRALLELCIRELGVLEPPLVDSIINFVLRKKESIDALGKHLGLKAGILELLLLLFGGSASISMIDKFGQILYEIGLSEEMVNSSKALLAFGLRTNKKFKMGSTDKHRVSFNSSTLLSSKLGIPSCVLQGMIAASNKRQDEMIQIIVEMSLAREAGFAIEESHARGIMSMALGQVDNIEDLCVVLKFDADIAEVLVTISGSSRLTYTMMKASSGFQKFALRSGLDEGKLAALLALTSGDIENANEIAGEFDETLSINPKLLKVLMAMYQYSGAAEELPLDYDPNLKTERIKYNLPWLCHNIEFGNTNLALLIIRLAQGDVSVLGKMYNLLGWSGIERSYYASFACLVNKLPFNQSFKSDDPFAWMAFKHLPTIVKSVSSICKLDEKLVALLIKAGRHDIEAIQTIKGILGFTQIKETIKFIDELVLEENLDSEEDEEDFELDPNIAINSDASSSFSMISGHSEEEDHFLSDQPPIELLKMNKDQKIALLVEHLNINKEPEELPVTEEIIKMFLSLSQGYLHNLHVLRQILWELHGERAPVKFTMLKELLILSSGNTQELDQLSQEYTQENVPPEDSIIMKFEEQPDSPHIKFLMMLATGNIKCWDMRNETDQLLSYRIFHDPNILKGLTAVICQSPQGIISHGEYLSDWLELDVEMFHAIILISINSIDLLNSGIVPLTTRLDVDPVIAQAFIPRCYKTVASLENALQSMCDRIKKPPLNVHLVSAIYYAVRGDVASWVTLGMYYMGYHKTADKEQLDDYKNLMVLFKIITKQYSTYYDKGIFRNKTLAEGSIEMPENLANRVQTQKQFFLKSLGMLELSEMSYFKEMLKSGSMDQAPVLLLDIIIGISNDDPETIPLILEIMGEHTNNNELVKALINIFVGSGSTIIESAAYIEDFIEKTQLMIPAGVIEFTVGAVRKFPTMMIRGMTRSAKSLGKLKPSWSNGYLEKAPEILLYIIQNKLLSKYKKIMPELEVFAKRLFNTNVHPENRKFKILIYFITGDLLELIKAACEEFGIEEQCLKEIYSLSIRDNPLKVKRFTWMSRQLTKLVPKIPEGVFDSLLKILSGKIIDYDFGREGMGLDLYRVVKLVIEALPKEYRIESLVKGISSSKVPAEIKILDAFFLAITDPFKYKHVLLDSIPNLARVLISEIDQDAIDLVTGLIGLFQSTNDAEARKAAILRLAQSFNIDSTVVNGLISLSRGDWMGLSQLVSKFCEFDAEQTNQLVQLMKRLKLIDDSENDRKQQKDELTQLKDKIDSGNDIEQLFLMLDTDNSGVLTFDQFAELMKFFNLKFTKQRLLEIFSKFDDDGSATLNIQEFEEAVNYIKAEISKGAMNQLGLSKGRLLKMFLVSLMILLFLFAFIFFGIMGFISFSQFGTAVNSLLPVSSGAILSKLRSPGDLSSKIDEIAAKVLKVLSVLTINDL